MAVQLAKAKGANVAGTASARNKQFLRELGVDQIIDYQATHFEDAVHGVHVVFDTSGNDTQARSFKALKQRGTIVSTVSEPSEAAAKANGFTGFMIMVQPSAAQLDEIGILIDLGKVRPRVGMVLPLPHARKAHELIQSGHAQGKIVLQVSDGIS
jgi:NADPH:quinone reductase-like Zn-dependent oxidoreductase